MKHALSTALVAGLMAAGSVEAADGPAFGIGIDYSSGDYGTDTTTEILSVPVTARYDTGNWTFKASLPWMRVSGDPNVIPGVGSVINTNPRGRGRAGGGTGAGSTVESETAAGIGDLRLAATYRVDTGSALGVDLTMNAKLATADENKGLGTGANDFGLALDLYRDFSGTTVFGGVSYTALGESEHIDVGGVAGANIGASRKVGQGSVGLSYDWREAASTGYDDRSELTGFYTIPVGGAGKLQLYALAGLSDGSPDYGAGLSYSRAF